jgi:hypothetical protein
MWLDDIALIWARNIHKCVISLVNALLHCLLVIESCVFVLDQSSNRRSVTFCTFFVEIAQCLIEDLSVLSCSSVIEFTKYFFKLLL